MAAQPLDVIAGFSGAAVLIELSSANFTAAAVVGHPADAWQAERLRGGTGALSRALALCLRTSRVKGQVNSSDD